MYKLASALTLAAVSIAPAQAATQIILNSENTDLPGFTLAEVIQDFQGAAPAPDGSPFIPNSTNTSGVESTVPGIGAALISNVPTFSGLTGDYLEIGRLASYTISFAAAPISFFSFAFNITNTPNPAITTLQQGDTVTLTYSDMTTQVLTGFQIIGSPAEVPLFGRVSYDTGTGPQITSVSFLSRGNNDPLRIDDIAAAVPEPATWLMMILGFGFVGSQLRRRKTKTKVTFAAA